MGCALACVDPYDTAKKFERAGWTIVSANPSESEDPLVDIELFGSRLMLGITPGYVEEEKLPHVGCGAKFFILVPRGELNRLHDLCREFNPSIEKLAWGSVRTSEVGFSDNEHGSRQGGLL